MSYFSHLACTVCNAQYPKDRVMNLCERDGRPAPGRARSGATGLGTGPRWLVESRSSQSLAFWRPIAARLRFHRGSKPHHDAGRGPYAERALCASAGGTGGMPAGGEGRGAALSGIWRESNAVVQGSRDGDDRVDGPFAGADAAGGADAGECRGLAGRICRGGGDRGGHRDVARHGPAGAGQGGGLRAAVSGPREAGPCAGDDHRLRPADPRGVPTARLFQRRDVPGAGLAYRGKEDPGAGDGRTGRRAAGRSADGNCPT